MAPHIVQERLHASDVAGLAAVAVALEHGVRPVLGEVGEQVLDHRVGPAAVGAEQQGIDVAGSGAGGRGAQRLAGAGPVHALHPGHVFGRRVAVHRQRQGAVGGDQSVDAGIEHGVVDDVRLAGDQHHGEAALPRPREGALADGVQPGLEAALRIQGRLVRLVERAGRERGAPGAVGEGAQRQRDRAPHPRRVEPVAFLLEEHRTEHAGVRALGAQRAPDHVGRTLRHRAGIGLGAGVGQRQVHEDRREEDVDVRDGKPVQQLDRRTSAGSGAAPVAVGERVAARPQHLDTVAQPAQQGVEERQRVDQVVGVGQADQRRGGGAVRAAGLRPAPRLVVQQRPQQGVALPVRVGRVLGELVAGGGHGVVLGTLATAHDLLYGAVDVDLRQFQVAAVQAVAVAALELAAPGDARLEHAIQVDGRRRQPRPPRGRPRLSSLRPPPAPRLSRRGGRCRRRPSRRGPRARLLRARAPPPACAQARGRRRACPGRTRGPGAGAGPSPGCGSCAPRSAAGRRRCPRGCSRRRAPRRRRRPRTRCTSDPGRAARRSARPAARTRRCRPPRGRSPAPRGTSRCRRCTRGSCPRRRRGRSRR